MVVKCVSGSCPCITAANHGFHGFHGLGFLDAVDKQKIKVLFQRRIFFLKMMIFKNIKEATLWSETTTTLCREVTEPNIEATMRSSGEAHQQW